jgi:hypothetical protein
MPIDDTTIAIMGVGVTIILPLFWALYNVNGKLNKLLESHDNFKKFSEKIDKRVSVLEEGVGAWFKFAIAPRVKMQCDLSCTPTDISTTHQDYKEIITGDMLADIMGEGKRDEI